MSMVGLLSDAPATGRFALGRTVCAVGACCLLLLVAAQTSSPRSRAVQAGQPSLWSVSTCDGAAYPGDSPKVDLLLSDARFVAQGWRWSPGSTAWVAVLVRVDFLKTIALARIGGLYGP